MARYVCARCGVSVVEFTNGSVKRWKHSAGKHTKLPSCKDPVPVLRSTQAEEIAIKRGHITRRKNTPRSRSEAIWNRIAEMDAQELLEEFIRNAENIYRR